MTSLKTVRISELQEVWESWNGWYWCVTEYHEGSLAFGLVRGWELEWGYFDLDELRELEKESRVWKVPKKNWAFCPCVDDAVSYSRVNCAGEHHQRMLPVGLPVGVTSERGWQGT